MDIPFYWVLSFVVTEFGSLTGAQRPHEITFSDSARISYLLAGGNSVERGNGRLDEAKPKLGKDVQEVEQCYRSRRKFSLPITDCSWYEIVVSDT